MLEDEIRRIAREVVRDELAKLQSDRPDAPLTAGQVRLVHARRSAAGVSPDELRVLLGERVLGRPAGDECCVADGAGVVVDCFHAERVGAVRNVERDVGCAG